MWTQVSPNESDLTVALVKLRAQNPTLGIGKLHALLVTAHPDWIVSEKRTKKVLQNEGLVLAPPNQNHNHDVKPSNEDVPMPTSRVVEGLDVAKWTSKVEVKYLGKSKGKGLVATERIAEEKRCGRRTRSYSPQNGMAVPMYRISSLEYYYPRRSIYDLQVSSGTCAHCSTPLTTSSLVVACPASAPCTARFCSRLCLSRSSTTHPLLCPAQNPASTPLLAYARKNEWMALHALARCTARVLLQEQTDEAAFAADWEFVRALAQLGMEERAKGRW